MEISSLFKDTHIAYLSKAEYIKKDIFRNFLDNNYTVLRLDWTDLTDNSRLIKFIYKQVHVPDNFGINWNALWDTLTDREFWFTKPSVIIIENYGKILSHENTSETEIFTKILMDLPQDEMPFLIIYIT